MLQWFALNFLRGRLFRPATESYVDKNLALRSKVLVEVLI